MIRINYAKYFEGFKTRILSKYTTVVLHEKGADFREVNIVSEDDLRAVFEKLTLSYNNDWLLPLEF